MTLTSPLTTRRRPAFGLGCWLIAIGLTGLALRAEAGVSYLNNKIIKIGVNLDRGGSITYFAQLRKSTHASYSNVVNSHDLGRQIQQSYYSGPNPFDPYHNQAKQWSPWPWNPIQTGDCYGHKSRVLDSRNDGKEIYVKTRPMQWALDNVAGEATLETWIRLEGIAAWVRCRLTNNRTDTKQQYVGYYSECPAAYTVGTLYRLFTYQGLAPRTGDKLTEMPRVPPPWQYWRATECWGALVNKNNWGLGVYHPGALLFCGGFSGAAGSGGPSNSQTGYISPFHGDALDHNVIYEYEYALVLGSLDEIRQFVYGHQRDPLPDYRFLVDRQHWYCPQGDGGCPTGGYLRVNLASSDPMMVGPPCAYQAKDAPKLYITAAYHVPNPKPNTAVAQLYWEVDNEGKPWKADIRESQSAQFDVFLDDEFHAYTIDLAACPSYKGLITQLRFDPVILGSNGDYVDVRHITYRSDIALPGPAAAAGARAMPAGAAGAPAAGRPAAAKELPAAPVPPSGPEPIRPPSRVK